MELVRLDEHRWEIPRRGSMRVPGRIYANERMIGAMREDQALQQVANVAALPGIVNYSIAMPDMHWGYGFPIGGVAAFDMESGVISPGGVGYDINCGVRLLRSSLKVEQVSHRMTDLVNALFRNIPSGVGSARRDIKLSHDEVRRVLEAGAAWAVRSGFGRPEDLEHVEAGGRIPGPDTDAVSDRALERGRAQLGTLGSGNHFGEIQRVAEIHDEQAASALGLFEGQVAVTLHSGSRGLGYQVCDDYLQVMLEAARRYGIELADRQLCCAPLGSPEAKRYMGAMAAAANFAFANRQMMTHWVRQTFESVLGMGPAELGLDVVYDVCHNIAKVETHVVGGVEKKLCVHRKGATRAFPPGHPETPAAYRSVGQPVLIPGDMGRYSYVLVGTMGAFRETFGSTCHGAGRRMSRSAAARGARGRPILRELADRGIIVRSESRATLLEEIPEAYKDVAEVVDVVHGAGIARKVARLVPMGVIKG
ncbi:MAG TPA: RtcB family protein [Candidatus Polarisedimenticolia bacterium]|jgi:tRNA-splicing ligase RtcB